VLKEHITADFLVARFGHDDFFLADTKDDSQSSPLKQGSERELREVIEWPQRARAPLSVSKVEERFDLDNMTNWFVSVLYSATTDAVQGAVARDRSKPDGRWFWINWDMDHAFMDFYAQATEPWQIDQLEDRRGNPLARSNDSRVVLFHRLRTESEEYRLRFLSRLTEVLNHELTVEFMEDLIDRYDQTAAAFGIEEREYLQSLRPFAEHRPAVLREQMDTYFSSGPSYRFTVSAPVSLGLKVDGRDIAGRYTGWYFTETPARIDIGDPARLAQTRWMINGQELDPARIPSEFVLSADTLLEIQFRAEGEGEGSDWEGEGSSGR
jgi:hypothetical protein